MSGFGQKIEIIDLPLVKEDLTLVPGYASVDQRLTAAQSVHNLQRPFCETDSAGASTDLIIVVQHKDWHVFQRQIQRGGKPDRACANHDNGMMCRGSCILIRRPPVRVTRWLDNIHHVAAPAQPCKASHICRSRSAVQIRGVSIPNASS